MLAQSSISWTPFPIASYRHPPFIISSKFQRRRQPQPQRHQTNLYEEDLGSMGRIVLTSLKTQPIQTQSQSKPDYSQKRIEEEEEKEMGLSGSDVLWALQRATKEKKRSRSIGKGKKKVGRRSEGGRDGDKIDYGDVKDLNIRSDWETRLNELENRLQQLNTF